MDIIDKDFDIDPEILKYFENLTLLEPITDPSGILSNLDYEPANNHFLGSDNGDGAEKCISCEKEPQKTDLNNIVECDFQKYIKIESDESINFPEEVSKEATLNEEKAPFTLIKKEDVKSEPLSDSCSSDDENYISLLARGPEITKKRSHKKKVYEHKVRISSDGIDPHKLLSGSSGMVLENNSSRYQFQANLPGPSNPTSSNLFIYKSLNYNAGKLDSPISSPESRNINSPESAYDASESGYDTCQSSAYSPSPSVIDSPALPTPKTKEEILNEIFEIEREFNEKAKLQQTNRIYNSCGDDIGEIANRGCAPIESVIKNIVGTHPQNRYVPLNCFNNNLINPVENTDELLNDFNELFDLLINQSTCGTADTWSATSQNPTCCRPAKQEEKFKRKISYNIEDNAKRALRYSDGFDVEKYQVEAGKMLRKIKYQSKMKEKVQIIEYDEREKYKNLQQTNLHTAVIESNIEKVLCIIETLKAFRLDLFDINNKDANKKTALDYAIKQDMLLLINYLEENNAVAAVECKK